MQLQISPSMRSITISSSNEFTDLMKIKLAATTRHISSRTLFHTILILAFLLPFVFILTALVTLEGLNNCSSIDCLGRRLGPRFLGRVDDSEVLEEGDSNKIDQQKQRRACGFDSGIRRFLGHKDEFHQWKLPTRSCDFESGFYGAELGAGAGAGAMECSVSDVVHQCKLCNKNFSSYQALGGHMTSHRMIKSKSKKSSREESVDRDCEDDESVKKEKKMHRRCVANCSRMVHALGCQSKCQGRFML